ncbi:hypothetical protein [Rhodococcus jostii]|uniref:hypothetical protein n=1 Tax=Rhodococcus jostii TaxID=132919 RepID=UPI0036689DE7
MVAFAEPADIVSVWRPLSAQETANATLLLTAAAQWIRDNAPNVANDDPAAKYVSIDVVKSALLAGPFTGHASYSKTIGPWSKSGTLINPAGALQFTDVHKELLGISVTGSAHWFFGDC